MGGMRNRGEIDMTQYFRAFGLATVSVLATLGAAEAQFNQSAYTDLDLDLCTVVQSDDFGSTWACNGHKGIPVMVAESDLRMMVSFGLSSTQEKAASQTLPPFNHLGEKIEWRLSNAAGGYKPFAAIVRYFTAAPEPEEGKEKDPDGQILVVTRIEPGATCQVAWIDALANPDANELAQKAADEKAPDFDCQNEPEIIGKFAAWEQ
jgi:hypothetical protein